MLAEEDRRDSERVMIGMVKARGPRYGPGSLREIAPLMTTKRHDILSCAAHVRLIRRTCSFVLREVAHTYCRGVAPIDVTNS